MAGLLIRVRVIRERLSATPGHVIGQGPAPGEALFPAAAAAAAAGTGLNIYRILLEFTIFSPNSVYAMGFPRV